MPVRRRAARCAFSLARAPFSACRYRASVLTLVADSYCRLSIGLVAEAERTLELGAEKHGLRTIDLRHRSR